MFIGGLINAYQGIFLFIMPMPAWGMHPHVTRTLEIRSKESRYSYWDYIDAFSEAFFYMNPPRNHSWFIRVIPELLQNDLPTWFLVWWNKFGIQIDAFPEDNKVPHLKRVFFYKWWNKIDDPKPHQELLQKIKGHTQACWDATPKLIPAAPTVQNPFVQIQNELRQKYPALSEQDLVIKSMDCMKEQFLQSFSRDDTSMKSGTSHGDPEEEGHTDPYDDENTFTVLAGESQDPAEEDPNLGDFWDSLTDIITEKMAREKDKKGKGKEE
ncbi:unnamed protein product [Camellia sinensis]